MYLYAHVSKRILAVVVAGMALSGSLLAADWPVWLGPDQNGTSPETGVFESAYIELDVAWRRTLGLAYSGVAVSDGRAVTMYGDGEFDWLVAFNVSDGKELWRYKVGKMFPKIGNADGGQTGMPVIGDGTVYVLASQGKLFAVKLDDGKELWSLRIDKKLGARSPRFGFTTTPLPIDDLLFVETGGAEGRSLTAFDSKNGEVKWSTGDDLVGYQSPIVAEIAGRRVILAITNSTLIALAPNNGEVVWSHPFTLVEGDGASTPVLLGDDRVFLIGDNESGAYRVKQAEGGYEIEEIWRSSSFKRSLATPVLHDGHLYGYNGTFLTCVDIANGEVVWKSRDAAAKGLILVDGHLVILSNDGALIIAEASSKGFNEKARAQITDDGTYTYPSFSDGRIFVRNLNEIAIVTVGAKP